MEGKKVKVPDEPPARCATCAAAPWSSRWASTASSWPAAAFPECRGTKRLVKDTGGICPKCGKGRMLERKSAKGRIYYGCERYPDCDFMTWDMPGGHQVRESAAPPSSARAPSSTAQKRAAALRCRCRRRIKRKRSPSQVACACQLSQRESHGGNAETAADGNAHRLSLWGEVACEAALRGRGC